MRKYIFFSCFVFMTFILFNDTKAQNYKLKQVTDMMGMKSETTVYIKGMRKRTEGGGMMAMMGMPSNMVTIEQCDLQRTVKMNDKKKLYIIEPFAQGNDEVIEEDAPKPKSVPPKQNNVNVTPQKGGTITQWYSINDTNERKKMFVIFAELEDSEDSYSIYLTAGLDGYADLKISFRNRQWISYYGTIEKIEPTDK